MRIKYNTEIISGIFFLLLAATAYALIESQIQTMEKGSINAQTFPKMAIGGMFIFAALLLLQGIFISPKKSLVLSRAFMRNKSFRKEMKNLEFAGLLVLYIILLTYTGYIPATSLLVIGIISYYKSRKWYFYGIPLATVGLVYFVFKIMLDVTLP